MSTIKNKKTRSSVKIKFQYKNLHERQLCSTSEGIVYLDPLIGKTWVCFVKILFLTDKYYQIF